MSDEFDETPEPPPSPDKPNESDKPAQTGKRSPWWLRSSLWFALGTISTGSFLLRYPRPRSEENPVIAVLIFAGLNVLSALAFTAWARFRAKSAINWKAYGFFLPLACGSIYPLFVVAVCLYFFQSIGETFTAFVAAIVVCVIVLPVLAEFSVRLQPPERPWYQYSLRSLLIFMLVTGVFFGCLGKIIREAERQRSAVNWIEEMGGLVYPMRNFFGFNFSGITGVELYGNQVTDISPLKGLTNLRSLNLSSTSVKDLSPLKGLENLKWLVLPRTQVSDLSPLKGLTNLEILYLSGTRVSKEEVQKLQKALPKCWIHWDGK